MGSADEGTNIRVELDEVALQRLLSGDPCLMPCVDCGYVTKYFCQRCWGEDHFPQDKAHGLFIPLCPRCERVNSQCHFCRREDWCDPPAWWDQKSLIKHALMLPDQSYNPLASYTHKDEKQLLQNREQNWDPVLQYNVYLLRLQSTENARPSSSSTEAASGDLHT